MARLVRGHTQGVEDRHAGHRKLLSSTSEWYGFVARAVNGEAERWIPPSKATRKRECSKQAKSSDSGPGPIKSVLIRYHNHCARRDGRNRRQSESWTRTLQEWASLPPETQAAFVAMHEAELQKELLERRTRQSRQDILPQAAADSCPLIPMVGGHVESPEASRNCRMEELRLHWAGATKVQRVLTSPLRKECLEDMLQRLGLSIRSAAAALVTLLRHGLAKDRGNSIATLTFAHALVCDSQTLVMQRN